MLYVYFICAADNLGKNTIWATYDGVKYIPSAYDLDATWGLYWNGTLPSMIPTWSDDAPLRDNLLFVRLLDNYHDEIVARYIELREDVLSHRNIENKFSSFIGQIPAYIYTAEAEKWTGVPNKKKNNLSQILTFSGNRIDSLDTAFDVEIAEKTESAWRVGFACENGAQIYVYPAQDYSATPVRAAAAYSVNGNTGELTQNNGQVNFRVDVPEGYLANVEAFPADAFNKLKTPAETGAENTYRITKITDDLTVRVFLTENVPEPEGWNVSFVCDPGVDVWVYPGSDYSKTPEKTNETVSVESATGIPTKTDGQVNFLLASENETPSYEIRITPDLYKNLKGPDETGQENTWRITKIKGNLTVTVLQIPHTHSFGEAQTENLNAATCTERGSYESVVYCDVCKDELSRETVYIDPSGHAWGEWVVVREATVDTRGLRQSVCVNDPNHMEQEEIPTLNPPEPDDSGSGGSSFDFLQWLFNLFRTIINFWRSVFRIS